MAEMAWMTNDPDTLPFLALRTGALPDKGGFNLVLFNPEVDVSKKQTEHESNRSCCTLQRNAEDRLR